MVQGLGSGFKTGLRVSIEMLRILKGFRVPGSTIVSRGSGFNILAVRYFSKVLGFHNGGEGEGSGFYRCLGLGQHDDSL